MRRLQLKELHDDPRFPPLLRDYVTDALQMLWRFGKSYHAIMPRLTDLLSWDGTPSVTILDLCSGGGGPWPSLMECLPQSLACTVCLSDKYPNLLLQTQTAAESPHGKHRLQYLSQPLDAMHVPSGIAWVRTIFSAFHHFDENQAREILANSISAGTSIAVFEVAHRNFRTMLAVCFTPLLLLLLTPLIRPFRWHRLTFTYLVPIIPIVIWIDGIASCLRAYSHEELQELIDSLDSEHYQWQLGEEEAGLLQVTYLIGRAVRAR